MADEKSEKILLARRENDPEAQGLDAHLRAAQDVEHSGYFNASGHRDQLKRQYGLLSICGLALAIDNAWVALGGSITVSIGG